MRYCQTILCEKTETPKIFIPCPTEHPTIAHPTETDYMGAMLNEILYDVLPSSNRTIFNNFIFRNDRKFRENSDTDKDGLSDSDEFYGKVAESNPITVEAKKPTLTVSENKRTLYEEQKVISNIWDLFCWIVKTIVNFIPIYYIDVTITAEDNVGLKAVSFGDDTFAVSGKKYSDTRTFLYNPITGLHVAIAVTDVNGNGNTYKVDKTGAFDVLVQIYQTIAAGVGWLSARAQEVLAAAMDVLIKEIINGLQKIIQGMIDVVLKPIKDAMKGWVKEIEAIFRSTFDAHSPITTIGDVLDGANKLFNFIMIPIIVITAILTALSVMEIIGTIATVGASYLLTQITTNIVTLILTSIFTMCVLEAAIIITAPTVEGAIDVLGDWGDAFSRATGVISFFTAFALLSQKASKYIAGAAKAILALIILTFVEGPWWLVGLMDIFAMYLSFDALFDVYTSPDDVARSVLSPLVGTFGKVAAYTAIVGGTAAVATHILQGKLDPSVNP